MQNPLARLDLSKFRIDSESFVGQAIALGVRFDKLPSNVGDVLLGFLRAKGLHYGKRNRSGIAIGREDLEHGVRQALIALDLGLEERAKGDLNDAVEIIARGDFEACRKRGYEIAFFRLEEMVIQSKALLARPEATFLQPEHKDISHWATVAPETWVRPPDDDEEESQLVDPNRDYLALVGVLRRFEFLRSMPGGALAELESVVEEGRTFDGLLRNLILALAMDLESLLPEDEQIDTFGSTCFDDGQMNGEVRAKIFDLMDRQLEASVKKAEDRAIIRGEFEAEVEFLEDASITHLGGLFLVPDESDPADDLLAEANFPV